MEERQNVFQRKQARTLTEDQKNRFQRVAENRAARLKKADTTQDRIERREAQRNTWLSGGRGTTRSTGVLLDPETEKLRSEMEAEKRQTPATPQAPPSPSTIIALITTWERNNENWYPTEFNSQNFTNCLLSFISSGRATWSYESLDEVYRHLFDNGFPEEKPKPRKRGDFSMSSAPKTYPVFLSDEMKAAELDRQRVEGTQQATKEVEAALAMPFSALQKAIRKSLTHYGEAF